LSASVVVGALLLAAAPAKAERLDHHCTWPYCTTVARSHGQVILRIRVRRVDFDHGEVYSLCVWKAKQIFPRTGRCRDRLRLTNHGDFYAASPVGGFQRFLDRHPDSYLATWYRHGHMLRPRLHFIAG
jgi:hypothetical protein